MKNFTLGLLGLLLCSSAAYSEVIDSVLYNPSRLGRYEQLKISETLKTKGGLKADKLDMNGQITVEGSGSYNITSSTTVKGSVDMPDTTFNVDTLKHDSGTATFGKDSVINSLTNTALQVRAKDINAQGNVYVKEDFWLGGNKIPLSYLSSCSGELDWVAYKYKEGETTKEASVLGIKGCAKGAGDCTPTHNGKSTYTMPCPSGKGNMIYTWDSRLCTYIIDNTACESADTEKKYVWKKGTVGNAGSCSLKCKNAACVSVAYVGNSSATKDDIELPTVSSLPSTYPANHWSSPTCNASNVGRTCTEQGRTYSNNTMFCNCVTYTCSEQ